MGLFKRIKEKKELEKMQKEIFEKVTKEALEEQKKNNVNDKETKLELVSLEQVKKIISDLEKISNGSFRGSISYTIFHKSNAIKLYFFADNDEQELTKEHLDIYNSIIKDMNSNDDNIINQIKDYYKIDDYKTIEERFRPISIMIFDGGHAGIVFEDLNVEEGWSDREIVVEIKPNISYFGSVDDYA